MFLSMFLILCRLNNFAGQWCAYGMGLLGDLCSDQLVRNGNNCYCWIMVFSNDNRFSYSRRPHTHMVEKVNLCKNFLILWLLFIHSHN